MNKQIWKFTIIETDTQTVLMPEGAEILTVQVQREAICLWALVNPENKSVERIIETFGTGHEIKEGQRAYIGTYQIMGDRLVFHVFERTEGGI